MLNNNMRCFEIDKGVKLSSATIPLNNNMRCFEIWENQERQILYEVVKQ